MEIEEVFELLGQLNEEQLERREDHGLITRHLEYQDGEIKETYALTDAGREHYLEEDSAEVLI